MMNIYEKNLVSLVEKTSTGEKVTKEEVVRLLSPETAEDREVLFEQARKLRTEHFQDKVFLYGFVYFSTFCRNNCNFCYYRRSNEIGRYRKSTEEILEVGKKLVDSGVHLLDLTMGEDPHYHEEQFHSLLEIVKKLKQEAQVPVMISPGLIPDTHIDAFAEAGADWYALYQETHNQELFKNLRIHQKYEDRMMAKARAKKKGMLIEEGLLVGVGENREDIAHSLLEMGRIGAKQVRVMSFVPQKGIPMEHFGTPDRELEFTIIAAMRVLYPFALIPASLDVDGISGLKARMDAGANVITSIIPPMEGLMGVAQNTKDVDDGGRSVPEVKAILKELGLRSAEKEDYVAYLKTLQTIVEPEVEI